MRVRDKRVTTWTRLFSPTIYLLDASSPTHFDINTMSGFDRDQVFVVPVRGVDEGPGTNMEKPSDVLEQLRNFLMNFQVGQRWVYRSVFQSSFDVTTPRCSVRFGAESSCGPTFC